MSVFVAVAVVTIVAVLLVAIALGRAQRDAHRHDGHSSLSPGRTLKRDRKFREHGVPHEDEVDRRLEKLRDFQRAEKIREAEEEADLERRPIDLDRQVPAIEDEHERRLRQLREFQRAEKIREAEEEALRRGPVLDEDLERNGARRIEPISKLITQEVIDLRQEQQQFKDQFDRAEVNRLVAEARDLIVDLNAHYGWTPGEPSIADRMFNTDVESVLGNAISTGRVDFRAHAIITRMRWFARAEVGNRNELSKVMATRAILGTGQLTEEELGKLVNARRLLGDDFAEASGFVDRLSRAEELVQAKKLGVEALPDREPSLDLAEEERRRRQRLNRSGPTLGR